MQLKELTDDNSTLPDDTKQLPEPKLTQFHVAIWRD